MEIKERQAGIFIPMEIWTIKNLNIDEKIILSDIYNKSNLKNFKGYIKKNSKIVEETGIKESNVKKALKNLSSKGYVINNPVKKRINGVIKTVLNRREIDTIVLNKAERNEIDKQNKFYSKNPKGIFATYTDLEKINRWERGRKDEKKNYKRPQQENLILFLLLHRAMFYDDLLQSYLTRFSKNDMSEFYGITRQTTYKAIENLTKELIYNEIKGAKLLKLTELEGIKKIESILETLKLHDMDKGGYIHDNSLYFINTLLLRKIGLDFGLLENFIADDYYREE